MSVRLAGWMLLAKVVLSCLLLFSEWARWYWVPVVSTAEVLRTLGMFSLAFALLFGPSIMPSVERLLRFSGWGLALTLAILSLVTHFSGHGESVVWRVLASATSVVLVIGLFEPYVLKRFLKERAEQQ